MPNPLASTSHLVHAYWPDMRFVANAVRLDKGSSLTLTIEAGEQDVCFFLDPKRAAEYADTLQAAVDQMRALAVAKAVSA